MGTWKNTEAIFQLYNDTMPPKFDVLAVGNYTIDLIFTGLPRLPEIGKEVYSTGFDMNNITIAKSNIPYFGCI